ncbi:MAG: undecaprenyl/decaprenyl-phosphate alpha-N-acetylglucosaminyl 1-phosphate transferase [Caldisericia bacterium]|nr:undecaprenyl/decaprenyl-phosphate alpha-N-acetylglucosaminyl 1-phosphate transferase [Caldisericia bacterium]
MIKNFLPNFYYLIIFFFVSLAFTPLSIYLGKKFNIISKPHEKRGDKEKIKKEEMPRSGGISIYISFLLLFLYIYLRYNSKEFLSIFLGGSLIFAVGLIDDKFKLKPWMKFLGEILGALIPIFYGVKVNFITNPKGGYFYLKELSIPFTIFWVTGITNAINIIDGLDGLASGIVSIVSTTLGLVAILKGNIIVSIICFAVAGIAIGFLVFNFPPAKIYLGDSGALLFGFLLGEIAVWGALKTTTSVILLVAVLALGFPILDTFSAILRRIIRRKSIFEADMDHIHYKLLYSGFKEKEVIIILYILTLFFSLLSFLLIKGFSL